MKAPRCPLRERPAVVEPAGVRRGFPLPGRNGDLRLLFGLDVKMLKSSYGHLYRRVVVMLTDDSTYTTVRFRRIH